MQISFVVCLCAAGRVGGRFSSTKASEEILPSHTASKKLCKQGAKQKDVLMYKSLIFLTSHGLDALHELILRNE